MNFKAQLEQLNTEINNHDTLAKNKSAVDSYSEIANRLEKVNTSLKSVTDKQRLIKLLEQYGGNPLDTEAEVFFDVDKLLEVLESYKNSWNELNDKSLQEENNFLYNLENDVKQKTKELSSFHEQIWELWLASKRKDFFVPPLILQNQIDIYKNKELHKNYTDDLSKFEHELGYFDFKEDSLVRIDRLAESLTKFSGQMKKDDLPESVQKFFNSVNNYKFSRPTLDLLTEEVFIWLKENDMLSQFMVTPNV